MGELTGRSNLASQWTNKSLPYARGPNSADWSQWEELSIRIGDLSRHLSQQLTARDLWNWFSIHGTIVRIDIFDDSRGRSSAKVVFCPPPRQNFWQSGRYTVQVPKNLSQHETRHNGTVVSIEPPWGSAPSPYQSKLHPDRVYPRRLRIHLSSLDFGAQTNVNSIKVLRTVQSKDHAPIRLEFDATTKRFFVFFFIPGKHAFWRGLREFKLSVDVAQMSHMYQTNLDDGNTALVLPLARPPRYFFRHENIYQSIKPNARSWALHEAYYRATEVAEDITTTRPNPVAIHNETEDPEYVEIGRWTTFRFVLPSQTGQQKLVLQQLQDALEDFNIRCDHCPTFEVSSASPGDVTIWSHLSQAPVFNSGKGALALLEHSMSGGIHLPFPVRYQLEVCISRGLLSEYTITPEFLQQLEQMDPIKARLRLEYLADQDGPLYSPMSLLDDPNAEAYQPHLRIPHYCALVRKAVVTPTTIRFSTANPETSNRVYRRYQSLADRFLRVQFVEESEQSKVFNNDENDAIWHRVLRTLYRGIQIGERNYEFLAFGSSQLRECGAYFFCPTQHTSCDDIRSWMGQFDHIKVVAKYAARLGQCFSTTREIRGIHVPDRKKIPDVERNGLCFTDGVGKISKFLAQLIIGEMGLDVFDDPTAFQFRMGGCKGVLAVWPDARGQEVHIRDSQEKFEAEYNGLEIIRCASFATATLNRQTITILESLGVHSSTFMELLDLQLERFEKSMTDKNEAIDMLTQFVDENQTTLVMAELLKADFKTIGRNEPFVTSILNLWRAWSLKLIKEKARIPIEQSAFVLGCVDETASLRGHDSSTEGLKRKDVSRLPQIFLQLSDPKSHKKTHIIEGTCIVGRNPSLHPGDIRVVQAVNEPKLHHLKDVVVFPMTGDKPVPSMLSGGDLDGDDFFIIWDKKLLPKEWNYPPMDYTAPKPRELDMDVNVDHVRDFFVSYMKNDVLGVVAYAHLGHADKFSPKHDKCIRLAEMHSRAVDFAKTGEDVGWDQSLQPAEWPHFMEQKKKKYTSKKTLGMIYDKVCGENLDFVPDQGSDFDDRIIGKYDISCDMLKAARDLKSQYDMCVRRILSQHALDTDFELWSGFALSKPAVGSDYKRQEQLGKEYDTVKQRFRELCYEVAGGHVPAKIDPFVAAMYQVTKEDVEAGTGSKQGVAEVELDEGADSPKQLATTVPLISFPWIFHWVLIRIALGDKYKPSKIQLGATGRKMEASITASDPSSGSPKPTGTTASSALQVQEKLLNVPLVTVEEMNVGETPEELLEEDLSENEVMVINDDQVQSSIDMLAQMGLE